MKRYVALLLLCIAAACGKKAGSGTARPAAPVPDGWLVYEDDLFRVAYPAGCEVSGAASGKQNMSQPGVIIMPHKDDMIGAVGLTLETGYKGMLLRDALDAELREFSAKRGGIIGEFKRLPVKNAQCLTALLLLPPETCHGGPPYNGQGTCYIPSYTTYCDGPDGRRYQIVSVLTQGREKALVFEAQRQAAVYEKVVGSLEFKKPAP